MGSSAQVSDLYDDEKADLDFLETHTKEAFKNSKANGGGDLVVQINEVDIVIEEHEQEGHDDPALPLINKVSLTALLI